MQHRIVVDEKEVFAGSGLDTMIISSCKPQVLVAAYDFYLWISLLKNSCFVFTRGIIYHDYLYGLVL